MPITNSGNNLSIAAGTADVEFYDGVATYGFRYSSLSKLNLNRGDGFAGQVASGGQTYDDASPFKRKVYDNFLGGFGQLSDNKINGGVGIGGDDTKYFFADAMTDRAGYILPGMRRNLIYNTYAASVLPVTGDLNPNAGDEYEVPTGIVPLALSSDYSVHNSFTIGGSALNGVTNIRCLINLMNSTYASPFHVTAKVYQNTTLVGTFSKTITATTDYPTYNGWCWINLTSGAVNFTASTSYEVYFQVDYKYSPPLAAIGCYINNPLNTPSSQSDTIRAYFQICKPGSATSYKSWAAPLRRVHQLLNGTTYVNVAVTNTGYFNVANTAAGGTSANDPTAYFPSNWTGSIVQNNKLLVFCTSGVVAQSAANAANNSGTWVNGPDAGGANVTSPILGYGNIYFVTSGGLGISKWNGTFPFAATTVVAPGTVGDPGTVINKIFFFQGNLWAAKPEGMFCLYGDPALLGSSATYTPRIIPMGDPFPTVHQSAGSYTCLHQGNIFINYKDRLYMYTVGASGTQVQVIPLPMPWYRLGYYHQIDGLASDGVNLFVSYNNLGVFKYVNQVWHPVTELYETINTEPTNSGLTWVANPTQGCDNLYFRDSLSLVQLPMPNPGSPYTRQFTLADQNKCGYMIFSLTDMEAAEMKKYVYSIILTAVASGFNFLVRPVIRNPSNNYTTADPFPGVTARLVESWACGLIRDRWMVPSNYFNNNLGAAFGAREITVQKQIYYGIPYGFTSVNTYWAGSELVGTTNGIEKKTFIVDDTGFPGGGHYFDALNYPAIFNQAGFILYFWNPLPNQASKVGTDIMVVDSVVAKYQTIQDFLGLYKLSVSISDLTQGRSSNLSAGDAETSWEWLFMQLTAHRPLQITIKVRELGFDSTPGTYGPTQITGQPTRTFLGFLQNPSGQFNNPVVNLDTNQPLPERVDFQIVSVEGESRGV